MKNWAPFDVVERGHGQPPRSIHTAEGIGDRLRAAAFAEFQARDAFFWAAETFADAPYGLRDTWQHLAAEEDKHLRWLRDRMAELRIEVGGRRVSAQLWHSLISRQTAEEFATFMASAEERGRKAGERFYQAMLHTDPVSAEIFRQIAEEEVEHILVAQRFFPASAPGATETTLAP